METSNRDYRDYRDYDNRDYREDYRDYRNYRDDYRTRDYDRRGGKINNRSYRNYREEDYREELDMICEDMRELYRRIEDVSEMVDNPQEKNVIMKVAQAQKDNYNYLKQIMK